MAGEINGTLPLKTEEDIVAARQKVRVMSQALKFSLVDQTKFITAASELARNTLRHGGGGEMRWAMVYEGVRVGLRLDFVDEGPGIANTRMAMTDGWTSGGGMGLGLPGSKRLVHEFELESAPGKGTRVSVTRWK